MKDIEIGKRYWWNGEADTGHVERVERPRYVIVESTEIDKRGIVWYYLDNGYCVYAESLFPKYPYSRKKQGGM